MDNGLEGFLVRYGGRSAASVIKGITPIHGIVGDLPFVPGIFLGFKATEHTCLTFDRWNRKETCDTGRVASRVNQGKRGLDARVG